MGKTWSKGLGLGLFTIKEATEKSITIWKWDFIPKELC